jgi:hypothetical protein
MRKVVLLALVVTGLLLGMAATRWLTLPPPLRAANAPGQFDAVRAKARLARVLGNEAPHPADSVASDGVRERLVAELRALGLEPRFSDRFACNKLAKSSGVSCARVRNVLVTIGSPASAPGLLINSHYDSVPVGPGASDAGLGVAAMLEALALMKDRQLPRQVSFLFNEGEELGLIGARSFLDADPLSRRVDALINLEARGTTGPVNMFETSVPNRAAVKLFKDRVSRPVANSMAVSAYRLLPNATDVNTFVEERDWLFLNFAPIGNETRYHSPGDDLAAIDLATLQHMGDQLLEVGGALARGATPVERTGETMFMSIGTRWLFTMAAMSPAFVALVLAIGVVGDVVRRGRRAPVAPVATAMPLLLLVLLVPVALAWAGLSLVGTVRDGQFWRAHQTASELAIYAGVIAAGLALLGGMKRWSLPQLRRAWWLLFVVIGIVFSIFAPGAMVYFVLPPLVFLVGALAGRRWPWVETAAALLAALVLFVTLGAALGLVQDLINSGPLWVLALLGGLVLMPWLIEARPLLEGWRWSRLAPAALAFFAIAWVPAGLAPAYSADRQQQWTLQYGVDQRSPQPFWSIVNDRKPLPAAFDSFGRWEQLRVPGLGTRPRWVAPARPQPGLIQPRVLPLETGAIPGGRRVRVRLQPNGSNSILLVADPGASVVAAGTPGQVRRFDHRGSSPTASLNCTGRSCDGAVLEFWLRGNEPLKLLVVGTRWSLPPSAGPLKNAQPANARAQYLPDATILLSRVQL